MTGTKWKPEDDSSMRFSIFCLPCRRINLCNWASSVRNVKNAGLRERKTEKKRLINRSTHWKITCVTIVARQLISILARVFVLIIVASSHRTKSRNNRRACSSSGYSPSAIAVAKVTLSHCGCSNWLLGRATNQSIFRRAVNIRTHIFIDVCIVAVWLVFAFTCVVCLRNISDDTNTHALTAHLK